MQNIHIFVIKYIVYHLYDQLLAGNFYGFAGIKL